jgi:hypothetical protein
MVTNVGNRNKAGSANTPGLFRVGTSITYMDPLSGKVYPSWMVAAVDELLYKVKNMDLWQTVDFVLDIWAKRYPTEHKQFLDDIKRYRATRVNEHASTRSNVWRELIMMPPLVDYLLHKIAWDKVEDYGEDKFKREFSRRYAALRPGDKY